MKKKGKGGDVKRNKNGKEENFLSSEKARPSLKRMRNFANKTATITEISSVDCNWIAIGSLCYSRTISDMHIVLRVNAWISPSVDFLDNAWESVTRISIARFPSRLSRDIWHKMSWIICYNTHTYTYTHTKQEEEMKIISSFFLWHIGTIL